ncbi:glycine cleavage T C-terminal barrel domain-containing protein [Streptomyces canus]|uniref:glycine cleavage T C-terminal barrel domain-containing protein n=1 Tax=Streptomyces canus TaxID=58343 RepID=UPI003250110C
MEHLIDRQRARYQALLELADRPFDVERPAVFSPAAAAQDEANVKGLLFRWTPVFIPYEYTNWGEESLAHVRSCYIGDWSAIGKLRVHGTEALTALTRIGMNNLSRFEPGQIKHHVQLDERGHIASEGLLYRVAEEEFVYSGGGVDWTAWQIDQGGWDAKSEVISPDMFIFEIQGPTSLFALEAATGESLRDIGFNRSRMTSISGIPVRILRSGISGELGYELHGSADDANAVWTAVVEAGAEHGIRQLGMRSQLVAHIEAGIATVGIDYLPSSIITPGAPRLFPRGMPDGSFVPTDVTEFFRRPGELGWGRRGALTSHDFIGRDALAAETAEGGPARHLAGLHWNNEDVIALFASQFGDGPVPEPMEMPRKIGASLDQVLVNGRPVGVSTSRTYSTHLRRTISLCVIDRDLAAPGTEVTVLWGNPGTAQRELRATVTSLPMKEDRRRTDVSTL